MERIEKERANLSESELFKKRVSSIQQEAIKNVLARYGVSSDEIEEYERDLVYRRRNQKEFAPQFRPELTNYDLNSDSFDLEEDSKDWVLDKAFMNHIEQFQLRQNKSKGLTDKLRD